MKSLRKNDKWDIVNLPNGRRKIGSNWVFQKKPNVAEHVEIFKARLVAKGYSQVEGVGFNEIFSHVAKLTSIRVLMSSVATIDLDIEKMDVKIAFLHGNVEQEIYMKQLEGFTMK